MEEEKMLKDELKNFNYANENDVMKLIEMHVVFKIQEGIYVMHVPGALLYMIGESITKVKI